MKSRELFIATAFLESLTGIALLLAPSFVVNLLLGEAISTSTELTISRIGGSAILALGIACWLARDDEKSRGAKAITGGLLVYNVMVFVSLANSAYTAITTPALIAALIIHLLLGINCIFTLKKMKNPA